MRSGVLIISFLTMVILADSCIDAFNPKVNGENTRQLVVDGAITDQPGPHTITLSYVRNINSVTGVSQKVSGATVSISDNSGNVFLLTEEESGIYKTDPAVSGVIGRLYTLHIQLDDKEYASDPEELLAGSEISSIRASYEDEVIVPGTSTETSNTVLIYLDIYNDENAGKYRKFDWDATYLIESLYRDTPDSCPSVAGNPYIPRCYTNEKSNSFLNILSMSEYQGETYEDHFLINIDPNIRFMLRYSINVTQYTITRRAYNYWAKIKDQAFQSGSLFDPPPAKILGNVFSLTDSDEDVLGYFMASSVNTKREFFSSELITSEFEHFSSCDCLPWRDDCEPPLPPDVLKPPPPPLQLYCCDCTYYPNSTAEQPDYWIE